VAKANGCEEPFDPARDYFADKVEFRHAVGVRIEYHKHYKLMTIHPGGRGKRVFRYVLLQCGAPKPDVEADAFVTVPARRIVMTAYVFEAVVELLGLHDRLIAVDDHDRVAMPGVRKMVKEGRLPQVGCCSHTNIEQVMGLKPDALFNWYFENDRQAREEALTQAGIPSIFLAQQPEPAPLGVAEWTKAFAAFFNREGDAERHFVEAERAYNELASRARSAASRPKVLFAMPDRDSWYALARDNSYSALLADAGGDYFWPIDLPKKTERQNLEVAFQRARSADVWLHVRPAIKDIRGLLATDQRFGLLRSVQTGNVYAVDGRSAPGEPTALAQQQLINPHFFLADVVYILHPELLPNHKLVYYRKLAL
jgi:iron complex transport system substrate-binding protein